MAQVGVSKDRRRLIHLRVEYSIPKTTRQAQVDLARWTIKVLQMLEPHPLVLLGLREAPLIQLSPDACKVLLCSRLLLHDTALMGVKHLLPLQMAGLYQRAGLTKALVAVVAVEVKNIVHQISIVAAAAILSWKVF